MNKNDIIEAIASEFDFGKAQAGRVVEFIHQKITDTLDKGESVIFSGFGTYSVGHRAEREGRNPHTGETMRIPASKVVKFKAGKKLKEKINQ